MNRKQRRALKLKNNEPTYMVKRSDMKGHLDSILKTDSDVQRAIQEEAHRTNLLEMKQQAEDIDALILITLHKNFGFGKKRLLRFVSGFIKMQKYYEDRYDDCDMFAIKTYLKDKVGIDVSELQKEVERLAKEESAY